MSNISYADQTMSQYGLDIVASGYSPESMTALLSAYSTLRDRYNHQKSIIRQLQDQVKNTSSRCSNRKKRTKCDKLSNGYTCYTGEHGDRILTSPTCNNFGVGQNEGSLNAKDLIEELKSHVRKFEALLDEQQCLSDNACMEMSLSLEMLGPKFRQLLSPVIKESQNDADGVNLINKSGDDHDDVSCTNSNHQFAIVVGEPHSENCVSSPPGVVVPSDKRPFDASGESGTIMVRPNLAEAEDGISPVDENVLQDHNLWTEEFNAIASIARTQQQQLQNVCENLKRQNKMLKFLDRHFAEQTSQQAKNVPLILSEQTQRNLSSAGEDWSLLTTV